MAFCPNCGVQNSDESKFCASCETPLEGEKQQVQQTTEEHVMEYAYTQENVNQQADSNTQQSSKAQQINFDTVLEQVTNTADITEQYDAADIEANKGMSILCYLSWLVIIPLLSGKKSKYLRFHMNQGLVLAIIETVWGIVYGVIKTIFYAISIWLGILSNILGLVNLVFVVFIVLGIVNVANGKAKELPYIGKVQLLK